MYCVTAATKHFLHQAVLTVHALVTFLPSTVPLWEEGALDGEGVHSSFLAPLYAIVSMNHQAPGRLVIAMMELSLHAVSHMIWTVTLHSSVSLFRMFHHW